MIHVPARSGETEFFTGHRGEEDAPARGGALPYGSGNEEGGHDPRRVVIGAVVDRIPVHRAAHTDVIVVAVNQDVLVAQIGIDPGEDPEDVDADLAAFGGNGIKCGKAGCQSRRHSTVPARAHDVRDPLEVSAVAGRQKPNGRHFPRNHRGSLFRPRLAGHPPQKGVVGELGEQARHAGLGDRIRGHRGG